MLKKKIIFVPGLAGNIKQARAAKKILGQDRILPFKYDTSLKQPIEEISLELKKFIDSHTSKKEKVSLLGISAGGIISDYYRKFISPEKIDKIITICSPFEGSYITENYSKKREGVKELSENSLLLKKLKAKKVKGKTMNFYCPMDILVPGNSGKGENPVRTNNFFHFTVHKDKKILKKVKEFLEK